MGILLSIRDSESAPTQSQAVFIHSTLFQVHGVENFSFTLVYLQHYEPLSSSTMTYRLFLYPVGERTCDVACMLVLIVLGNQLLMQLFSNSLFKVTSHFLSFPTRINERIKMLSQARFFIPNTWL